MRHKYAKPGNGGVVSGKLPARPIEKGIPSPALLAVIIMNKFVYHLPIHRQIKMFKQMGATIPANTIDGWQDKASHLLRALHAKHIQSIIGRDIFRQTKLQSRFSTELKRVRRIRAIIGFIIPRCRNQ